jgi:hypothetical protein
MATRKEHLAKADELLAQAERLHPDERAKLSRVAEAHTRLAEAMRPTRPTFGTTRISRKGQGR